jgi:hypothetical protein
MSYARARTIRNPASFKVDGVEYKDQVSKVRLVPDTPTQTMRTWGGVDVDRDSTAWVLEVTGHQDRGTGGFAKALETAIAANDTCDFEIVPRTGIGEDKAAGTFVPVPVEFGGEAGSWKSFEAEFGVLDQPTFSQTVA